MKKSLFLLVLLISFGSVSFPERQYENDTIVFASTNIESIQFRWFAITPGKLNKMDEITYEAQCGDQAVGGLTLFPANSQKIAPFYYVCEDFSARFGKLNLKDYKVISDVKLTNKGFDNYTFGNFRTQQDSRNEWRFDFNGEDGNVSFRTVITDTGKPKAIETDIVKNPADDFTISHDFEYGGHVAGYINLQLSTNKTFLFFQDLGNTGKPKGDRVGFGLQDLGVNVALGGRHNNNGRITLNVGIRYLKQEGTSEFTRVELGLVDEATKNPLALRGVYNYQKIPNVAVRNAAILNTVCTYDMGDRAWIFAGKSFGQDFGIIAQEYDPIDLKKKRQQTITKKEINYAFSAIGFNSSWMDDDY